MDTTKPRKSWADVLQTLSDHRCKPRLLYQAKLSITIDGQNRIFHDRTRFSEYLATNPALHKVLEWKLQPKDVSSIHKNTDNRWSQSKFQRRKKPQTITSPTMKTIITGTSNHWSLISLNINGLNSPIKRHRLTDWIWKQNQSLCCIQETHLNLKDRHCLWVKGWKKNIPIKWT